MAAILLPWWTKYRKNFVKISTYLTNIQITIPKNKLNKDGIVCFVQYLRRLTRCICKIIISCKKYKSSILFPFC